MPDQKSQSTLILEAPDGRTWSAPVDAVIQFLNDRRPASIPATEANLLRLAPLLHLSDILFLAGSTQCTLEDVAAWAFQDPRRTPTGYVFRIDPPPTPTPDDGWGHAQEASTVQDLLKEEAAAKAGKDHHERLFQGLPKDAAAPTEDLASVRRDLMRLRQDHEALTRQVRNLRREVRMESHLRVRDALLTMLKPSEPPQSETEEILSDRVFADRLRESIQQARMGKTVGLGEAEDRLLKGCLRVFLIGEGE